MDFERELIVHALNDPKVVTETGLGSEHFQTPKYRIVWKNMLKLGSFDVTTLSVKIPSADVSSEDLEKLSEAKPKGRPAFLAEQIRQRWTKRELLKFAGTIRLSADRGTSADKLMEYAESRLREIIGQQRTELPTLKSIVETELDNAVNMVEPVGLDFGLGVTDYVPGGAPRDKLTVIFGQEGNFKTTVKNSIVKNLARRGYVGLDISLEDSDELTAQRNISDITGIPYGLIAARDLTPEQRTRIAKVKLEEFDYCNNIISGSGISPDIDSIIQAARQYKYTHGLDYVTIDYLQLLEGKGDLMRTLNDACKKMQRSSKRDRIGYIALSQVKQDLQRQDGRPVLRDMLASPGMRQSAKLAIAVYRPWARFPVPGKKSRYYMMYQENPELYPMILELIIRKNVLGTTETLTCLVNPATGVIEPYDV